MSRFVVLVDFRLKPGNVQHFRRLIAENARASCRDEEGCRQFDVLVPKGESNRILLYEIYDDEAAFDAHVETMHFAQFDRDSRALVESKTVIQAELLFAGSD
jgi:autoinducer 2-degrading protein